MGKKDRGAFQRKKAQKIAKQKSKKARAQRTARQDVPLAYTGSRYQGERYVLPLMTVETAILAAHKESGEKLLDSDVRGALAVMVKHLHSGPQDLFDALVGLSEIEVSDARQRQIILSIVEDWLGFFETNRHLPRADLVGILRTLVHSLDLRTEMHPGGRGYLRFLDEFLPEAITTANETAHRLAQWASTDAYDDDDDDEDEDDWEDDALESDDSSGEDLFGEHEVIDVTHRPASPDKDH